MTANPNEIVVVSGLPRSGTSMMMRMLQAGGLPLLADAIREADTSNPKGYYEYEPVKRIKEDVAWIGAAQGKAVKIVAPLVRWLPPDRPYAIIFLRRSIDEVLASQSSMMGVANADETQALEARFRAELNETCGWLGVQPGLRVFYQDYRRAVQEPATTAAAIAAFLNCALDVDAMAATVDPALYRERRTGDRLANFAPKE